MTVPTGAEIRELREALGFTQKAAAALVHVDWQTWNRWERGVRTPHPAFWELFLFKTQQKTP